MNSNETQPLLVNRLNNENASSLHSQLNCQINGSLTLLQKISFGLGHIYNDLCAAMWFSYTLLFLQAVLHMESTTAGSMMLLGQVIDALATPIIGVLADRCGSKRLWHLIGTFLVLCSFPFIFARCIGCWMSNQGTYLQWWQPIYYAVVIVIFQIGWAIVQISHLAMIPVLTESLKERSELTAIRYMASVCSGVTVYLITWLVLHLDKNNMSIGPTDDYKFRDIALLLSLIGCILLIFFHYGLRQLISIYSSTVSICSQKNKNQISFSKNYSNTNKNNTTHESNRNDLSIIKNQRNENGVIKLEKKNFFLSPFLYLVALLYVASRLFNALSLVYVPLYLDERLNSLESNVTVESIASVPLVTYISSFFTSILLKYRNSYLDHKLLYIVGSITSIGACVWIATSLTPSTDTIYLYIIAILLGIGSSITMVTSLCITADLIGPHSNQGAVVYSVVTFADKLITGIAVITIEKLKCTNREDCPDYYQNILAYVCGGSASIGALTMLCWEMYTFDWIRRIRLLCRR